MRRRGRGRKERKWGREKRLSGRKPLTLHLAASEYLGYSTPALCVQSTPLLMAYFSFSFFFFCTVTTSLWGIHMRNFGSWSWKTMHEWDSGWESVLTMGYKEFERIPKEGKKNKEGKKGPWPGDTIGCQACSPAGGYLYLPGLYPDQRTPAVWPGDTPIGRIFHLFLSFSILFPSLA